MLKGEEKAHLRSTAVLSREPFLLNRPQVLRQACRRKRASGQRGSPRLRSHGTPELSSLEPSSAWSLQITHQKACASCRKKTSPNFGLNVPQNRPTAQVLPRLLRQRQKDNAGSDLIKAVRALTIHRVVRALTIHSVSQHFLVFLLEGWTSL